MSTIYLGLETADANRLWDHGPGFVRLAAFAIGESPVVTTTNIAMVVEMIEKADLVVGHNVLGFDLPALELYYGLDLANLVRENRVMDVLLAARQNDPPLSGKVDSRRYDLDPLAKRLGFGFGRKLSGDGGSVLQALSREFDGCDKIPVDHPDYVRHLAVVPGQVVISVA